MLPIQITVHNTELSPEAHADIARRAMRLSGYYERLMGCRVTIDLPQRRRHSDAAQYGVRIDMTVPDGEIVVSRQPRRELATALDNAFNAARRRLQDYARRHRGSVKAHEARPLGRVVEIYPLADYGFLESADGRRIYFDRNSVLDDGFGRLDVGSEVHFAEEPGEKGPQATTVTRAARHAVAPPE